MASEDHAHSRETQATLLTIGDELLIGQIVDTNSAWMGEELTRIGIPVVRKLTVGDHVPAIADAIRNSMARSRIVICTGGLGPTEDDRTTEAAAAVFGVDLIEDEATLARIRNLFEKRGRRMAESNRKQALIPEGFRILTNSIGTAPALVHESEEGMLVLLPGVPQEMKAFMQRDVLPLLAGMDGTLAIRQQTLLTAGIAESELHELIGLFDVQEGVSFAWLPSTTGVRIRITAVHEDASLAERCVAQAAARVREKASEFLFGEGNQTLEEIVGTMLRARGLSIAVAESGTGGLIASRITDIPGASDYMMGGAVTYSNRAKVDVLGVSESDINEHGAVSRQVAIQMAEGVRWRFDASIGISTTGIMGPGGGTDKKPVGTVWVGFSDADGSFAILLQLGPDRATNKERATTAALNLVRKRQLEDATSG